MNEFSLSDALKGASLIDVGDVIDVDGEMHQLVFDPASVDASYDGTCDFCSLYQRCPGEPNGCCLCSQLESCYFRKID